LSTRFHLIFVMQRKPERCIWKRSIRLSEKIPGLEAGFAAFRLQRSSRGVKNPCWSSRIWPLSITWRKFRESVSQFEGTPSRIRCDHEARRKKCSSKQYIRFLDLPKKQKRQQGNRDTIGARSGSEPKTMAMHSSSDLGSQLQPFYCNRLQILGLKLGAVDFVSGKEDGPYRKLLDGSRYAGSSLLQFCSTIRKKTKTHYEIYKYIFRRRKLSWAKLGSVWSWSALRLHANHPLR